MKIGIYGGTFDPPHLGHMSSAGAAMEILGLDRLLFLPAKLPPHKALSPSSATAEDRLAMTALMADGLGSRAEVCALEHRREGKSYTADTLRELKALYPEDELWLLMGSDMFLTLQCWHKPETICALAGIAAFARTEADMGEMFRVQSEYLERTFHARVCTIQLPAIHAVSSTQIRNGKGWKGLYPPVYGYILLHGLYGVERDLTRLTVEQLRACANSMVRAKRIPHIRGTEEEAVKLARRWGADEENARRAGILHDCTKYWSLEEHLACCQRYAVALDGLERRAVKLLHAKTGACMAKYVFGQSQQIYDAIYYHTTARAGMSLLEKILYVADYMEPNRAFDGVEELRRLAYTDLDAALLLGCEMSIQEMEERGSPVHENTLQARQWLKGNRA